MYPTDQVELAQALYEADAKLLGLTTEPAWSEATDRSRMHYMQLALVAWDTVYRIKRSYASDYICESCEQTI